RQVGRAAGQGNLARERHGPRRERRVVRRLGGERPPVGAGPHDERRRGAGSSDLFQGPNAKHTPPLYGLRKLKGWLDPQLTPIHGHGPPSVPAGGSVELSLEEANDERFFAEDTAE